jgi:pimeloyl-ACP methyl ester carboxylesterase
MHRLPLRIFARFLILIIGLMIGVSGAHLASAQQSEPTFEPGQCPFGTLPGVECGFVSVPENRANPDAPMIRLAVVVVRGTDPDAPLMILSGGPGEITTPTAHQAGRLFQQIAGGRTVILFDQRGVGRSEPALACPEWVETQLASLAPDITADEAVVMNMDSLLACAERLTVEGIDLNSYNSVESAADVADIVRALGFEQVNLLGVSYGSLLAQHVLRDHPQVVRAAIIDSVLPIDESFFVNSVSTASEALDRLLADCAADAACSAAYPDVRAVLADIVLNYNANPVPIVLTNPITGETIDSLLTGDTILNSIIFYLYQTPAIPTLPEAIMTTASGDLSAAESMASRFLVALYALERGMQYSVLCREDLVLVNEDDLFERYAQLPPEYRGRADLEVLMEHSPFDICAQWPVEPFDASIKELVRSDVPTLALAGEYDPVTPAEYAERVAAELPNSFVYTFPGVGHSVILASPCAAGIVAQFLDDPTAEPDASCIAEMGLTFRVPGATIALEPFTSETFGIRGVIPAGWQELAPGVYAQSASSTTLIVQQAAPIPAAQLRALLTQQFGLESFPEVSSEREANGLTWQIYETTGPQGLLADVAIAETNELTYVIVLLSTSLDRSTYYDGLFLPAIEALTAN